MRIFVTLICVIFIGSEFTFSQELSIEEQVDEALAKGQSFGGEKLRNLITLGPSAIPYLAERLYTVRLPKVILDVFAALADDSATDPLLTFLNSRRHLWGAYENDTLSQYAINALKEINDPRAEPLLYELATADGIHFRLQFHATVALARLGTSQIKQWAWETILDTYYDGNFGNRGNEQLITVEVFVGLCEVQSDEGIRLVSWLVSNSGEGYRTTAMLDVLNRRPETKDSPELIASMRSLLSSTKETHEYPVKMAALKTLAIHDETANKDDLMALYLQFETHYSNPEDPPVARGLQKVREAIERRDY